MEEQPTDEQPELTVSDAARIAKLSTDTIRRYSDSGKLPSFRTLGNQRRFRLSDVEALRVLTPFTPSSDVLTPVSPGEGVSSFSPSGSHPKLGQAGT